MRFKPTVIIGFGIGYLVGARAGRERYDAIMRQIREIQERPDFQGAAGLVSAQAAAWREKVLGFLSSHTPGGSAGDPFGAPAVPHSPNGIGRASHV